MAHIGFRASENLVEEIDNDRGPEQSRSEYVREAVRAQLQADDPLDRMDDFDARLDDLDDRLEDHDDRLEELEGRGLLDLL